MSRAEQRRTARQLHKDRAFLATFPTPIELTEHRVNIWACPDCGRPTIARDVHQGTTPAALGCRANVEGFDADGQVIVPEAADDTPDALADALKAHLDTHCQGLAVSTMYRLPPADATPWQVVDLLANPPWEWYVPTDVATLRSLSPEMAEHVRRGGLVLRKNPDHVPPAVDMDESAPSVTRLRRFFQNLQGARG